MNKVEVAPGNPYYKFRSTGDLTKVSERYRDTAYIKKEFDEPTYLTFKLNFRADDLDNATDITDFDRIPQPLFSGFGDEDSDLATRNSYSTLQYLKDMDENIRYEMLNDFLTQWRQLQTDFQWYFQSVEGIADLLKVVPGRGRRLSQEMRINIIALEGLDQRISHLLNLYRKIAWDDVYQRWILPDIMRYFRLTIYVTEFRTFHRSQYSIATSKNAEEIDEYGQDVNRWQKETEFKANQGNLTPEELLSSPKMPNLSPQKGADLLLRTMNNVTPTYVLELERCEFDIESLDILPNTMNVGTPEMREVNFSIKVGNLKERYINPVLNTFLYDGIINGYTRTSTDLREGPHIQNSYKESALLLEEPQAKGDTFMYPVHKSGDPFIQTGNLNNLKNSIPETARNNYKRFDDVNPTDPATWAGNALTVGKAFVENLVEQQIDKAITQKIPGLGISFNEGLAAIQSKNVFTLLGAARRAISENVADTLPSQELEDNFVDTQFREFLNGIVQSNATTSEASELQSAANLILSETGKWEEIKDLSKATDLLSQAFGEINIQNNIENPNALQNQYQSGQAIDRSISDPLVYEGPPSAATSQKNVEGGNQGRPDLGSTDGTLIAGSQPSPSEQLGSNAGESLTQPSDGLGSDAGGQGPTANPSEQLGTDAGTSLDQPEDGLGSDAGDRGVTANPSEQLGTDAGGKGTTANPSEQLGTNAGTSLDQPEDGLGSDAGGKGPTVAPSSNLGENAEGGISQGSSGLGDTIEGGKINIPKAGEATDGDNIEAESLRRPNPSKATNNDLD